MPDGFFDPLVKSDPNRDSLKDWLQRNLDMFFRTVSFKQIISEVVELIKIDEPSTPDSDRVKVWAEDNQGFGVAKWMNADGIAHEMSRDAILIVRNDTGAQIDEGEAVYVSGSTGVVPNVALAKADSDSTMPAIGVAAADIADSSFGKIQILGDLTGPDLSSFSDGDTLFVSSATAGALTATRPTNGFAQVIGFVINNVANGVLHVDPLTYLDESNIDHGRLAGLADDDHSFYPKGTLGYAEITSSQTGISSETDLTGLSVTVTVGTNRRLKITGQGRVRQLTTAADITGTIKEGSTYLGLWVRDDAQSGTAENDVLGHGSAIITPSSGSHTYKLTLETDGGTVNLLANSTRPAFILVEDIGPA